MNFKSLGSSLTLLLMGRVTLARITSADQICFLTSLPEDPQNSRIQSALGKGYGTAVKADPKLNLTETARSRMDGTDLFGQFNEDPALRADDIDIIDLTSVGVCPKMLAKNGLSASVATNAAGNTANGRNFDDKSI